MKAPHVLLALGILVFAVVLLSFRGGGAPQSSAREDPTTQTPSAEPAVAEAPVPETPVPEVAKPVTPPPAPPAQKPVERRVLGPLHQEDESGNTWMIDLASGQPYGSPVSGPVQPGPPVIVKTDVRMRSPREFSIGLVLAGQAGELYRPVVLRNSQRRSAPGLKIVSEAGQVLVDDSFRYG